MSEKQAGSGGSDASIQTFLRIRPSKKSSNYFSIDDMDPNSLFFNLPDNYKSDYINNSKLKHSFQFNGILDMSTTQEQVFSKVGASAVRNALEGFNSTIFAYGQTGSGKTFTLTGGPEKYSDRGLIPRSISMLFQEFRSRTDMQFKAYISYLELYNEQGYDLLDPSETKALEDMPKVAMLEDEYGNFHLKNLSMHPAETEEAALNLLFLGDTNRAIAETPMNMASSRSHCIFTISLEARHVGNDRVRRSKLHLVDLAGSERVSKTASSGSVLTEAKYINSSLFFLEMVIVALHEKATKGRTHVPYRNSMMTSVLRDSLGGNCKTVMIATINPEASHTEESLSTCRFAKRVSLIKNKASINEEQDPMQVIKRLKNEVLSLREEMAYLKGESGEGDVLSLQEQEDVRMACRTYVDDRDPASVLNMGTLTLNKLKHAFLSMKNLVLEAWQNGSRGSAAEGGAHGGSGGGGGGGSVKGGPGGSSGAASEDNERLQKQVRDLKSLLLQRDSEITILVNMVKQGKTERDVLPQSAGVEDVRDRPGTGASAMSSSGKSNRAPEPLAAKSAAQAQREREERLVQRHLFGVPPPPDPSIFDDAAASFEWFRGHCGLNASLTENKEVLREKMQEAKSMGERAQQSRNTIAYLKNSIEAIRRERALQRLSSSAEGAPEAEEESPEEVTYRRAIEQEKAVYQESFDRLRVLKPEIEHIRKLLEKCRQQMQGQFDQWFAQLHTKTGSAMVARASQETQSSVQSLLGSSTSTALPAFSEDKQVFYKADAKTPATTLVASNGPAPSKFSDDDVNEDIMAFYQAKEELLKRRGNA